MDLGAAAGNLLDLKDVLQRMMNQKLTEIWGLRLQMVRPDSLAFPARLREDLLS
jgi:hypothetical protein